MVLHGPRARVPAGFGQQDLGILTDGGGRLESNTKFQNKLQKLALSRVGSSLLCVCTTNQILGSIVVSISACHAEDPGSIPSRGAYAYR